MFKNHSDNIDFGSYKYYIRDSFLDLSKIMSSMNIKGIKICIVSDSNVSKLYTDEVKKVLNESIFILIYMIFLLKLESLTRIFQPYSLCTAF